MAKQRFKNDFYMIMLKVSNIWSQFLVYGRKFFTSKTYPRFVTLDQFLSDL